MSATVQLEPVARWRVSGESDGPQGADGVGQLAATAYAAMCAAPWEYDHDAAEIPVHEFDRPRPRGQAYKAVWGYDADARTQRSCCGAACLSYRIPADALDDGNADGVANLLSVQMQVAVDRYCDAGVQVFAIVTDEITPPSVTAAAAGASAGATVWFATSGQADAEGNPLAPNKRDGEAGDASFAFGEPEAPGRFLHVYLLMADYLGVRGAWIEGGAIFASESAGVEFSREVEVSADDSVVGVTGLSVGRVKSSATVGGSSVSNTVAGALAKMPRLSVWQNWSLTADRDTLGSAADASFPAKFNDMLAFVFSGAALYDGAGAAAGVVLSSSTLARCLAGDQPGVIGFLENQGAPTLRFAVLTAHGITQGRTFRGLRFTGALDPSMPVRLVAYGVNGTPAFAGASPKSATALPWWGVVISKEFRDGRLGEVRCYSNPVAATGGSNGIGDDSVAESATGPVDVVPLFSKVFPGAVRDIPFDLPWATGEISSLILAAYPAGVPSATSGGTSYDAAVTRTVSIAQANSGATAATRSKITGTATFLAANLDFTGTCYFPLDYLRSKKLIPTVTRTGDTYAYNFDTYVGMRQSGGQMLPYAYTVDNCPVRWEFSGLTLSFTTGGKTFSANIPGVFASGTKAQYQTEGVSAWHEGDESYTYIKMSALFEKTVSIVATASDGQKLDVTCALRVKAYHERVSTKSLYQWQEAGTQEWSRSRTWSDFIADGGVDATLSGGYSYAYADRDNGSVTASVTDAGSASFTVGDVTYTAQIPAATNSLAAAITVKSAAGAAAVGYDTTAAATATVTVPARSMLLRFEGSDGSERYATLALPSSSVSATRGNGVTARNAYAGTAAVKSVAGTVADGATVNETGASADIDPGLVMLYE